MIGKSLILTLLMGLFIYPLLAAPKTLQVTAYFGATVKESVQVSNRVQGTDNIRIRCPSGETAYMSIKIKNKAASWRSKGFKTWLTVKQYGKYKRLCPMK